MNTSLPALLRGLICSGLLLLMGVSSSYASHIFACELRYRWISGLTYEVTVDLYGDCGSTSGAFGTLPASAPQVCIYNSGTYFTTVGLAVQYPSAGVEVLAVCPDSASFTTCTSLSFDIPGIKKFVYSNTVTLPSGSSTWRFVYDGYNGTGSASGRTAAITNLNNPAATVTQLIDTLNTTITRGHNSSPILTVDPVPAVRAFTMDCYNPGAIDIYDTSIVSGEPLGDSLVFALVAPLNGSTTDTCSAAMTASYCAYAPGLNAWTTPSAQALGAATPIQCTDGATYSFNSSNGAVCFNPIFQRSTIVYNIDEYFHGVLTGTMQREMNFYAVLLPCSGDLSTQIPTVQKTEVYPNPATTELTISCAENITDLTITNLIGKTAYSHQFNSQNAHVDISGLPAGVYFVKINGMEVKKFVKE